MMHTIARLGNASIHQKFVPVSIYKGEVIVITVKPHEFRVTGNEPLSKLVEVRIIDVLKYLKYCHFRVTVHGVLISTIDS